MLFTIPQRALAGGVVGESSPFLFAEGGLISSQQASGFSLDLSRGLVLERGRAVAELPDGEVADGLRRGGRAQRYYSTAISRRAGAPQAWRGEGALQIFRLAVKANRVLEKMEWVDRRVGGAKRIDLMRFLWQIRTLSLYLSNGGQIVPGVYFDQPLASKENIGTGRYFALKGQTAQPRTELNLDPVLGPEGEQHGRHSLKIRGDLAAPVHCDHRYGVIKNSRGEILTLNVAKSPRSPSQTYTRWDLLGGDIFFKGIGPVPEWGMREVDLKGPTGDDRLLARFEYAAWQKHSSGPRCNSHLRLKGEVFGEEGWLEVATVGSTWKGEGESWAKAKQCEMRRVRSLSAGSSRWARPRAMAQTFARAKNWAERGGRE